jgi:hypothetical protein
MLGQTHNKISLNLKSKPGKLNLIFGNSKWIYKQKFLMSIKKSINYLDLYEESYTIIEKYFNQVELANKLNVSRTTISRYI